MARIRAEEPRDRDTAIEVQRLAFGSDEEAGIAEAVRDEDGSFALVAEEEGAIVGHVQFSRAWIGKKPWSRSARSACSPNARGAGSARG